MPKERTDPVVTELAMIRKLLVLALLKEGITQGQLGGVLGLSQQDISKMFPSGALAALKGKPKKSNGKVSPAPETLDG